MKDLLLTLLHWAVMTARLCGPGGVRAVIAENLLLKQQLVVLRRPRQRAPRLTASDRLLFDSIETALPVRLEFPILSLTPGLGTVAWRLTSARRGLADEGPPAHPASPGRHDREAVWPRWSASGDRGAFSAQAAADRRAPLRGGASHEAEGRRWARAGRVRAPAGRLRLCLCVLLQVGDQMVAGLEQFLLVDDVVAVEDGAWPSGCQR